MALIISPDGWTRQVQPRNGRNFQLDELQAVVQGYIELVHLPDNRIMVINEQGKVEGLPRNEKATALADLPTPQERKKAVEDARRRGVPVFLAFDPNEEDYIAGTVLVCEQHEVQ
ncbi:MAG: DUF3846 domain-containing protein [Chloroflexi bacterium]|nr:DUF3846 domain-containing protein [Chloroflexota bacterium]